MNLICAALLYHRHYGGQPAVLGDLFCAASLKSIFFRWCPPKNVTTALPYRTLLPVCSAIENHARDYGQGSILTIRVSYTFLKLFSPRDMKHFLWPKRRTYIRVLWSGFRRRYRVRHKLFSSRLRMCFCCCGYLLRHIKAAEILAELFQETIVNRTYGTDKNQCIFLFLPSIIGAIYYGPS